MAVNLYFFTECANNKNLRVVWVRTLDLSAVRQPCWWPLSLDLGQEVIRCLQKPTMFRPVNVHNKVDKRNGLFFSLDSFHPSFLLSRCPSGCSDFTQQYRYQHQSRHKRANWGTRNPFSIRRLLQRDRLNSSYDSFGCWLFSRWQ